MEIVVHTPTPAEREALLSQPVWECEASTFDWHYDSEETALVIEGDVTVEYNGKSIRFGAGDYVIFPKGLSCIWKVQKAVRKHYLFR